MPATVDLDALAKKYGGVSEEPKVAPAKVDYDSLAKKFGGQAAAPTVDHDALAQKHGGTPVEQPKLPLWQRAVSDEGAGKLIGAASKARQSTLDVFSNLWHRANHTGALSDEGYEKYQKELRESWSHIAPLITRTMIATGTPALMPGISPNVPAPKAATEFVAGAGAGGEKFAEDMLTNPTQIALMVGTFGESTLARAASKIGLPYAVPAARTLAKLMQLQFAAQMTEGAAQGAENTYKAVANGDWQTAGQSAVEGLMSGLMAHGLIDHEAAQAKVHADLDKTSRETHGKRFNDLNPYDQGLVIDETVKRSPEYQDILKSAEAKDEEAKSQIKAKRQKKLENYYGTALEQAWEPNAAKRAIHGLTQAEYVGEEARQKEAEVTSQNEEVARKKSIADVVTAIKKKFKDRLKEVEDRRRGIRREVGEERRELGKASEVVKNDRESVNEKRKIAEQQTREDYRNNLEAVSDDVGQIEYPVSFGGENSSVGVASEVSGHEVYRRYENFNEWLNRNGSFVKNTDDPFITSDPHTADVAAKIAAVKSNINGQLLDNPNDVGLSKEYSVLNGTLVDLINGEIYPQEAESRAGISEKINLPDVFSKARQGKLTGPYHDLTKAEYLSGLEKEFKAKGLSPEDYVSALENAPLIARQQTEQNLNHAYKSGDYIVSKRGVRWILDAKGMLRPDNGGQAIPLMKNGFYSKQAIQLAESGRIGYGRSAWEDVEALRRKNEVTLEGQSPREAAHERVQELAKQAGFENTDDYLKSRRLENEALKLGFANRAEMEEHAYQMGFGNAEDFLRFKQSQRIPEDESRQLTYQKEQAEEVKDRAEGKVQDPEPQTPEEAQTQLDGAVGRTEASQSVAVNDLLKAIDPPPTATEEEIDAAVQKAEESRKVAEQAVAQEAKAKSKLVGPGEYPQKAPITSRGFTGAQWAVGPSSVVHTNAGDIPVHLELVKPAQLTVSFQWNGNNLERNPAYPEQMQDVQPNERTTMDLLNDGQPQNYQLSRYLDPGKGPEHGPAIIDIGGDVVGGNRRLMRMAKYLENIGNDPVAMGNLRNQMREFAAANGMIYPAGDDLYIPVRMMEEPIGTLARATELGDLLNKGAGGKIDDAAKSITHGRLLYEAQLADEKLGRIGVLERIAEEFNRAETPREAMQNNPTFFAKIVRDYLGITNQEAAEWFSKNKQGEEVLKVKGKEKLEMALLSTVLKNPTTLEAIQDSQSYQSLLKAIGPMTRLRTTEAKDITNVLEEAVEAVAQTQRKKVEGDSPKMRWNKVYVESDMFSEGPPPPEPNRMVEALWRAMHDDRSTRLKNALNDYLIGEGRQKNAFEADVENKLPAELFNTAFQPELEEVRGSRGLETEGAAGLKEEKMRAYLKTLPWEVTQEEFDAAKNGKEFAKADGRDTQPAAAVEPVKEVPAEASQTVERQAEPAKIPEELTSPKFGLTPPPRVDTAKAAEREAEQAKEDNGGALTAEDFERAVRNHPATAKSSSDIIRGARIIAKSFIDELHPEDAEGEDHLNWLLRQIGLAGIERGDNNGVRGEYDMAEGIMRLSEAADATTFWHEWFHAISPMLSASDWEAIDGVQVDRWEWFKVWGKKWQFPDWKKEYTPDGKLIMPKGDELKGLQERLSYGTEKLVRDENPKVFKVGYEAAKLLERIKKAFIAVYKAFDKDPLSPLKLNDDAKQWIGDRFGIEGYDAADKWKKEVSKAKADEVRLKKPSEQPPALVTLGKEMGANRLAASSYGGTVEDSTKEVKEGRVRIDTEKAVTLVYNDALDAIRYFRKAGTKGSKIQDAQLIRGEDGTWGIRFNTEHKLPPDVLHQELPETEKGDIWFLKSERLLQEPKAPQGGSGEQWSAYFRNNGVKPDEMKWTGLDDFLAGKKKVSKAEVQEYIRANNVKVEEVTKGGVGKPVYSENIEAVDNWLLDNGRTGYRDTINRAARGDGMSLGNLEDQGVPYELLQPFYDYSPEGTGKYEQYTLGGEKKNYRELLLTLPMNEAQAAEKERWGGGDYPPSGTYRSGHWDEPNILAHIRFDERTDADGNRVLLVEEVQSDWHQAGKKQGYKNPEDLKLAEQKALALATKAGEARDALRPLLRQADLLGYDSMNEVLNDIGNGNLYPESIDETGVPGLRKAATEWREANFALKDANKVVEIAKRSGVPDAPFKQNWHEMAMRRMLRYGAEHGFDKVAWVTGEQTADRYDLSKQLSTISYSGSNLKAFDLDGNEVLSRTGIRPEDLPDLIGKDAAQKLMAQEPKGTLRTIEGLDLKVGGEWAKNLYDRAIPNYLKSYGKKWGAKVGETKIPQTVGEGNIEFDGDKYVIRNRDGEVFASGDTPEEVKEAIGWQEQPVHAIDVTPQMRRSVLSEGQPLFQGLPERHPGIQLEELEKQLRETKSYQTLQRQLLELKISNLKNRIRAEYGAEELKPQTNPELVDKALEESRRGRETANGVRKESHGIPGIQKPQGVGRISKPSFLGMPGHAGSAERGRAKGSAVARIPASLSEVKPVALEPIVKPRGTPVGTVTGEAFDPKGWVESLKRSGLPENAPAPTYALDPKTAAVLKFPGQKQSVQLAMSALEQGDGVVLANSTGSGKTYISLATVKEFQRQNPDAMVLHITKNRGLLKDAQKIAENSFGIGLETDAPQPGKAGVYGVSYVGLLNDKTYQNIKWDLVVADESGEARNWHTPDNQQGKMLKKVVENSRKAIYLSATPFHSPMEYGYLDKLNLWPKGQFDKWIEQNFAHEKIGDRVVARLDPSKQAKLRQQLIERGQLVSQAISYDGYTAHFGVVPVTDQMKRGLDRIHEGFARARSAFIKMGKKGMSEKAAAFEATYTKAFLERERIPQAIELAKQARDKGWQVMVFSETSSEDLFRRERTPGIDPSTYQELDDAMGGQLSKIIPPFENVYDRLKEKFGDEIGDYSGRGNTQASRDQAKQEFMTGKTPMLYSTYAAGGIGVSLHDADFPELNVKGGDKPRVAIFLGPPYSGVLLEQAMGRSWRFGVKSDVHAVFLATDSEPDVRLMQSKVGPRMRALRAAVLGEKDSLASAMSDYTDEQKVRARQDALAYAEGDEVRVNAGSYQVRSKSRDVGINNWSEINFPHADTAKNKGMKYGETVTGGDWTTLYQSKFGPFEPPPSPDDESGKKIINEIGNAAVSGKIPGLKDVDPADREAVTGLSSANATAEVDLPVDRDKKATARQSMESNLRNSSFIPYQGFYMSQELGIQNICRMAGKPEVGLELTRMERSEQAERNVYQAEYWNQLDDVLRQQGLYPSGFMSEGRRMKHLDDVIREMSYVMEGKKVSDNPAINRAAADMSDMMRIAHADMAKDGVRVTTHDGEKIPYSSFGEDPKYWPRRIDWDHELPDPRDPSKTIKLRDLLKPKFDEEARKRAIEAIPELRPYSTKQVLDYLFRNDPRAPLLTNVHHAREMNFPFYKRDYRTLVGYFDQVAKARSEARNFGWDEGKLNKEIEKITNPNGQATIKSMFRSLLHPQSWEDWSAKVYSFGMAYEAASKMTFSAFKLPGHLLLPPLAMDGRVMPIMKAMKNLALHPREVSENAAYVGTISRQLSAADAMYGEHGSPAVRGILKKEMFEAVYKLDRIITGESAKVYMEQYAMRDLQKGGTRAEHTRRILRDRFLVGDHAIDEAIARGRFSQEDLAKGQTAFANLSLFSDNPMQMPAMARMEINRFDTPWDKTAKRAIRLTYALKSFGIKATSLLRETMYDEMVVHHNFRMLPYVMVASPIVGEMILLMGQGAKHVAAKGMARLQGKQAQEDSWDKHLKRLEDLGEHPDAVKATKELIDTVSMGYGLEMMSMMGKPLYDIAVGAPEKSDQYWLPDALETLAGPFFADIYRTADEVSTLQKIHAGQKHPEQKPKKYERSIMQYAAGQVPALRNVPQVAEEIASKKNRKGFIYAPPGKE